MDFSPRLTLPYLQPMQAQKHVTLNDALTRLDIICQAQIIRRDLETPPPAPSVGDTYLIATPAAGDWQGKEENLARWQDDAWTFITPETGWRVWDVTQNALLIFTNGSWSPFGGESASTYPFLGINTEADASNRLAVKSDAVLLDHDDQTPGSGDVQLSLNKAGETQTASIVFKSDYVGSAEIGLVQSKDLSVKVSADGTSFIDAMQVDHLTGQCSFPATLFTDRRMTVLKSGSGTYTPPEGVKALSVCLVGAGGGGSGAVTSSTNVFVGAGGGGAGGVCRHIISNEDLSAHYTYSVGSGGVGGSADSTAGQGARSGAAGTETRFEAAGLSLVAGGGGGAPEDLASAGATEFSGGSGGTATGGELNLPGQKGNGGLTRNSQYYQIGTGEGASGPYGQGGAFRNGDGLPGTGYGSGGSGCGMIPGYIANRAGGDGAPGLIIIEEYY